jgi:glutaminase
MVDPYLQSLASSIGAIASPFYDYLSDLHAKYQPLIDGAIAPDLAEFVPANPDSFGVCVVTVEGQTFEVGDCQQIFPIQSLSRAFLYGLALQDWGRDYVNQKVGVEPSQEDPNSIVLDSKTNRPYNPLLNAGAIVTTDLIKGNGATERLQRVLEMFRRYTGRELNINMLAFLSEKAASNRDRAIAYLMLNFGQISNRISETLDLYFQQSAITVNCRDLAVMAATLANGGINPITKDLAIDAQYVQDPISVMLTCGMNKYSGEWTYRIGIPAQGAINGGMIAVVPQKLGIGIFSPLLDARGNSIRGIKVCEDISLDQGLHLFNIYEKNQQMLKYIQQVDKVTAAAAALESDRIEPHILSELKEVCDRSDELGQLARVFLGMVEQVKAREQKLKQQVEQLKIEIDRSKQAQQVAEIVQGESFQTIKQKLQRMKEKKLQQSQ